MRGKNKPKRKNLGDITDQISRGEKLSLKVKNSPQVLHSKYRFSPREISSLSALDRSGVNMDLDWFNIPTNIN